MLEGKKYKSQENLQENLPNDRESISISISIIIRQLSLSRSLSNIHIKHPNTAKMAPNTYTITIRNENGSDQNYSLINKKPIINGMAQEQIFSNVLCNLSTAAGQVAEVAIRPHYKAVVGTRNGDDGSVRVRVGMSRDVKLGEISSEGTVINGTTLEFALAGNGTPTFSDAELPSAGIVNAFAIKAPTNKGWDKSDAKAGKRHSPLARQHAVSGPMLISSLTQVTGSSASVWPTARAAARVPPSPPSRASRIRSSRPTLSTSLTADTRRTFSLTSPRLETSLPLTLPSSPAPE